MAANIGRGIDAKKAPNFPERNRNNYTRNVKTGRKVYPRVSGGI